MKNEKTSAELEKDLSKVIKIDETRIHPHLDSMVRDTSGGDSQQDAISLNNHNSNFFCNMLFDNSGENN
jgi:hypothetical protein